MKKLLFFIIILSQSVFGFAQCFESSNVYSFSYNEHTYKVVKENKIWEDASNCAVLDGGYLAEINSLEEQNAISSAVINNAEIKTSNTLNQYGTAAVWIGGSDSQAEATWIWDGDNDDMGNQFWTGGPSGHNVDGAYTNWGVTPAEPDNSGNQDKLTLTIASAHPNFGKWNDLASNNSNKIYYIIEYGNNLSIEDGVKLSSSINIYPNPFDDYVNIRNKSHFEIIKLEVINGLGQIVYSENIFSDIEKIELPRLQEGMYFFNIDLENGNRYVYKLLR